MNSLFQELLDELLVLTNRSSGFVAELQRPAGRPWALAARAVAPLGRSSGSMTIDAAAFDAAPWIDEAIREGASVRGPLLLLPFGRRGETNGVVCLAGGADAPDLTALLERARPVLAACAVLVATCHHEDTLRGSEERIRAILDHTADGIVTIDEGKIDSFNRSAERMFGYAAAEVIGTDIWSLVATPDLDPEGERDGSSPRNTNTYEYASGFGCEAVGRRKDGSTFPLDLSLSELVSGGHRLVTVLLRDISQRKRLDLLTSAQHAVTRILAQSETTAQISPRILEALRCGSGWEVGALWLLGPDQRMRCTATCASAPEKYAAFERAARARSVERGVGFVGRAWQEGALQWIADLARSRQSSGVARDPALSAGGDLRAAVLCPIRSGNVIVAVLELLHDRPARRDPGIVTMLESAASQVEQFIERKAAEEQMRQAKDSAERASHAKTEFLANMSHEIRTPLNAIIGVADLLSESKLESDQRQYVDMFRRAGSSLLALVNNVLDLSKVEAGQLEIEAIPFDLREVVSQAMDAVAMRASAKELELVGHVRTAVPAGLVGDPTRVRQVLINLLGNAIKFTERGEVMIRVEHVSAGGDPGTLLFTVSDSGIGIPEDKLAAVFERFSQVGSSVARTHGGTGLGLAICHSLVGLMGGQIWAESEPGAGTTMRFTARFALDHATCVPFSGWLGGGRARRMLVVDEHARTHEVLRELAGPCDCEVVSATSGAIAVRTMKDAAGEGRAFDIVLLDTRTARKGGAEAMAPFAASGEAAARCVLLLPTDAGVSEIALAREAGFASYLLKPLTPARMAAVFAMIGCGPEKPASARTIPPVGSLPLKPRTLLLVEDHPDNRAVVIAYMLGTPFQVVSAENGKRAVELMQSRSFDVVLMDMQMPVMDGYEATKRIRAWEREHGRPRTTIIALTANALKDELDRALEAGCDDHLTKPVRKQTLLRTIAEHVEASELTAVA